VIAITAPRERAARLQRHNIKEQIMSTPQKPTQPRPLRSTSTPDLPDEAAKANKPRGTELSDDTLDHVAGGQLPKPPQPLDPCIK
jgi:hypothetical protein